MRMVRSSLHLMDSLQERRRGGRKRLLLKNTRKSMHDYWKEIIGTDGDFDLTEEKEQ